MELESLKEILNHSAASENDVSEESLRKLLRTKSKSAISKMKRNLMIELALMILIYAYAVIQYDHFMPGLQWLLVGIEMIYLFYFVIKYRLLSRMENPASEVRSSLQKQLNSLENLLRFYLWSGLLLVPMAALASFWIGYTYSSSAEFPRDNSLLLITSLVVLLISILLCIPLYFFTKWHIRKLYGRHIEKLKEMMHELSEEGENLKN